MAFPRGDVVLLPFPFTDLSARKVRPAVILSSAAYHASEPDLILGAITTNLAATTAPVDYILADWQSANLRFPPAFAGCAWRWICLLPPYRIHRRGESAKRAACPGANPGRAGH